MLYIVIAVFIVLIIMNVFMLLVLRQVTVSTGKQIEKDAVHLFSVYDNLLEARSQKLEELDMEIIERMEGMEHHAPAFSPPKESAVLGAATLVTGRYRDLSFSEVYHKVKSHFFTDINQVIAGLQKQCPPIENRDKVRCMKQILEKFSFDAQYEISTLTVNDQMTLLEHVLEPDERLLYTEFLEEFQAGDLQAFLEWLRLQCKCMDTQLTLRVPSTWNEAETSAQIHLEHTDDICEGFVVLQGNKLYDYSI